MTCVRSKAMPVGVEKAHRRPGTVPHLYDTFILSPAHASGSSRGKTPRAGLGINGLTSWGGKCWPTWRQAGQAASEESWIWFLPGN